MKSVIDDWELSIEYCESGIVLTLKEINSYFFSNEIKTFTHEQMMFWYPVTKNQIKKAVKHWLSRFDLKLSEESFKIIDEFYSDLNNFKVINTAELPKSNLN